MVPCLTPVLGALSGFVWGSLLVFAPEPLLSMTSLFCEFELSWSELVLLFSGAVGYRAGGYSWARVALS